MAAAGQFVRERIPVPCTVPEAGRLVIELVGSSSDSHAETAGPMTFRIVRRYRPTWATLTGFLVAPLFVRRTELCRIAVIEARIGAELLIEGDMDVDLHESLLHLGRVPEAARVATLGPRPVPQLLAPHQPPATPSDEQARFTGFRPPDAEQSVAVRPEPATPGAVQAAPAAAWSPPPRLPVPADPFASTERPSAPAPRGAEAFGAPMPTPAAPAPQAEVAAASSSAASLRAAPQFRPPPPQGRPGPGSNGNGNGSSHAGGNGASGNGSSSSGGSSSGGSSSGGSSSGIAPEGRAGTGSAGGSAAPAAPVAVVEVSIDSGEQSMVGPLLLVGRAPSRGERESHARLLTVNDPSLSVSKTHLAIGVDPNGLWVTDRHSTNGTWLDEGLGELRPVEPGTRTTVPPGARVLIGERVLTFSRR